MDGGKEGWTDGGKECRMALTPGGAGTLGSWPDSSIPMSLNLAQAWGGSALAACAGPGLPPAPGGPRGYVRRTRTPCRRAWTLPGSMAMLNVLCSPPTVHTWPCSAAWRTMTVSLLAMMVFRTEMTTMGNMKDIKVLTCGEEGGGHQSQQRDSCTPTWDACRAGWSVRPARCEALNQHKFRRSGPIPAAWKTQPPQPLFQAGPQPAPDPALDWEEVRRLPHLHGPLLRVPLVHSKEHKHGGVPAVAKALGSWFPGLDTLCLWLRPASTWLPPLRPVLWDSQALALQLCADGSLRS